MGGTDDCVYSINDVVETLARFENECPSDENGINAAYNFASELIGLSVDRLMELTDEVDG